MPRPSRTSWSVYVVRCADGSLYTGVTTDLARRIDEHNDGPRAARYTRARRPVQLVYAESNCTRVDACRRENAIRHLTKPNKEALIARGVNR